jgi:hypothetical protein
LYFENLNMETVLEKLTNSKAKMVEGKATRKKIY